MTDDKEWTPGERSFAKSLEGAQESYQTWFRLARFERLFLLVNLLQATFWAWIGNLWLALFFAVTAWFLLRAILFAERRCRMWQRVLYHGQRMLADPERRAWHGEHIDLAFHGDS